MPDGLTASAATLERRLVASASSASSTALSAAAAIWLGAALLGQWAFFYYIAAFYGASSLSGDFEIWNRLQALGRTPFIAGDTTGNSMFLAHALGAGIIALGGALQLIPQIRARFPRFHRWNGRLFLLTVCALSLSGFYLVWLRGSRPDDLAGLSTSFNGVLILLFAFLAYRTARARQFVAHRRWAMRLYLVSNAQWFLRVGVFGYFVVSQLLGHQASFSDPFFHIWTFGCYLAPLLVLQLYLHARTSAQPVFRIAVAAGLLLITVLMAAGIVGFAMFAQTIISGGALALPG